MSCLGGKLRKRFVLLSGERNSFFCLKAQKLVTNNWGVKRALPALVARRAPQSGPIRVRRSRPAAPITPHLPGPQTPLSMCPAALATKFRCFPAMRVLSPLHSCCSTKRGTGFTYFSATASHFQLPPRFAQPSRRCPRRLGLQVPLAKPVKDALFPLQNGSRHYFYFARRPGRFLEISGISRPNRIATVYDSPTIGGFGFLPRRGLNAD